jgi:hypothetical protein
MKNDDANRADRMSVTRRPHDNPAVSEFAAQDIADGRASSTAQQRPNLGRALRSIENRLNVLVETFASRLSKEQAVSAQQAVSATNAVPAPSVITDQAPPRSPLVTIAPERADRPTIFLLIGAGGHQDEAASSFITRLGRAFAQTGTPVSFACWDIEAKNLRLASRSELARLGLSEFLGQLSGSYPATDELRVIIEKSSCGSGDWLLLPGSIRGAPDEPDLTEMNMAIRARQLGLRTAFIFHGAEPLRLRKYAGAAADAHEQYMQAMLLADAIFPASNPAASDLSAFLAQHQLAGSVPLIHKITLAARHADEGSPWSDYVRRVRAQLSDAADPSHSLATLYYWIAPPAAAETSELRFAGRLARALTERGIALIPVTCDDDARRLVAASAQSIDAWSQADGRVSWAPWRAPGEPFAAQWILCACSSAAGLEHAVAAAKSQGLRAAAVLHEASNAAGRSPAHERAIFRTAAGLDKLFAVSTERYREFERFLLGSRERLHSADHRFKLAPLPNEVEGRARRTVPKRSRPGATQILVAAPNGDTSHLPAILKATAEASGRSAKQLIFTFVGAAASEAERERLGAAIASFPAVRWEAETTEEQLAVLYDEADFAICAGSPQSAAQPLSESNWRGLPWLVHRDDDAASTSRPGIVTVDMREQSQIVEAILNLSDDEWRHAVAHEAITSPARSWQDYARDLVAELATDRLTDGAHAVPEPITHDVYTTLINLRRRPKLSLCISTYNRAGWLEINLRNIFEQVPEQREDLEVLVVDNTCHAAWSRTGSGRATALP